MRWSNKKLPLLVKRKKEKKIDPCKSIMFDRKKILLIQEPD